MKNLKTILIGLFAIISSTEVTYPILGTRRREAYAMSAESKKEAEAAYQAGLEAGQSQSQDFDLDANDYSLNDSSSENVDIQSIYDEDLYDENYADDAVAVQAMGQGSGMGANLNEQERAILRAKVMEKLQGAHIQSMESDNNEYEDAAIAQAMRDADMDDDYALIQAIQSTEDDEEDEDEAVVQSMYADDSDEEESDDDYAMVQSMDSDDSDEEESDSDYAMVQSMDADDSNEDESDDDYAMVQSMDADDSNEDEALAQAMYADDLDADETVAQAMYPDNSEEESYDDYAMIQALEDEAKSEDQAQPAIEEVKAPAVQAAPVMTEIEKVTITPTSVTHTTTTSTENVKIVKSYPVYEAVCSAMKSVQAAAQDMLNYLYSFVAAPEKASKSEVRVQK